MVEWWWLLIEAAALLGYAGALRGWTRKQALFQALTHPETAWAEINALPDYYQKKLINNDVRRAKAKAR